MSTDNDNSKSTPNVNKDAKFKSNNLNEYGIDVEKISNIANTGID